uniref:Uncharacterized protein n=1 Tax=Myoviridae sp. ctJ2i1 TaxID=2825079 RepID=A0A8S5V1Q9_9CAUD|nr:MAG TPA: hypothetical protein [Myoviridae sp. ctJ2i1]
MLALRAEIIHEAILPHILLFYVGGEKSCS